MAAAIGRYVASQDVFKRMKAMDHFWILVANGEKHRSRVTKTATEGTHEAAIGGPCQGQIPVVHRRDMLPERDEFDWTTQLEWTS